MIFFLKLFTTTVEKKLLLFIITCHRLIASLEQKPTFQFLFFSDLPLKVLGPHMSRQIKRAGKTFYTFIGKEKLLPFQELHMLIVY